MKFNLHVVNLDSRFSSAGVLDIDQDGKPDIVSGAFWYQSPTWKKQVFREVEEIRGRFDDYSNLVIDLNGDSADDIVSINYRSKSLYWVRNPGKKPDSIERHGTQPLWENIVIDRPGTSETGRLADIDGDGKLDILPAGTNFAAWYEFSQNNGAVRWQQHQLPEELIGHGIGVGDLNADGRQDVIGCKGWAEAPEDRRAGRWIWHPDFNLARDCSIPILCWDVDEDGDQDLVWSRAHNVGLYWTEQSTDDSASIAFDPGLSNHELLPIVSQRKWITHAIDTSWSNIHTILTADLDGDGKVELIAGKRYLAHDGKDPGEYDPLQVAWYKFEKQSKTWQRNIIARGGRCGIDLDTACVDLDQDGDLDIIAPSRIGLHWLENTRIAASSNREHNQSGIAASTNDSTFLDGSKVRYTEHLDLSYLLDNNNQRQPLQTPLHHGIRRYHIQQQMQQVMGNLPGPEQRVPLDVRVQAIEDAEGYWRAHITYAADRSGGRIDRVPAYLLVPKNRSTPAAAMLCLHQTHFQLGKGEPCGLGGNPNLHIAHQLAQLGFVCLAPDYPGFSEYAYNFAENSELYASGTMKGIWNHVRAVDVLENLPCVDRDAIGVIGHSLGGHNSLFVAAFDIRIRCAVTSCGFNAFEDYYGGNLKGWSSDRYMPRIATLYASSPKQMPFDFPEVLAAIAPRPVFVCAPRGDSNFAVVGVEKCERAVMPIYNSIYKVPDKTKFVYPDAGHDFPTEVRGQAYQWLKDRLSKP